MVLRQSPSHSLSDGEEAMAVVLRQSPSHSLSDGEEVMAMVLRQTPSQSLPDADDVKTRVWRLPIIHSMSDDEEEVTVWLLSPSHLLSGFDAAPDALLLPCASETNSSGIL